MPNRLHHEITVRSDSIDVILIFEDTPDLSLLIPI